MPQKKPPTEAERDVRVRMVLVLRGPSAKRVTFDVFDITTADREFDGRSVRRMEGRAALHQGKTEGRSPARYRHGYACGKAVSCGFSVPVRLSTIGTGNGQTTPWRTWNCLRRTPGHKRTEHQRAQAQQSAFVTFERTEPDESLEPGLQVARPQGSVGTHPSRQVENPVANLKACVLNARRKAVNHAAAAKREQQPAGFQDNGGLGSPRPHHRCRACPALGTVPLGLVALAAIRSTLPSTTCSAVGVAVVAVRRQREVVLAALVADAGRRGDGPGRSAFLPMNSKP